MGSLRCTFVISGHLDQRFAGAIEGLSLTTTESTSSLHGLLRDQAQAQGVLRQLFGLGLNIVSFSARESIETVSDVGRLPDTPRPPAGV